MIIHRLFFLFIFLALLLPGRGNSASSVRICTVPEITIAELEAQSALNEPIVAFIRDQSKQVAGDVSIRRTEVNGQVEVEIIIGNTAYHPAQITAWIPDKSRKKLVEALGAESATPRTTPPTAAEALAYANKKIFDIESEYYFKGRDAAIRARTLELMLKGFSSKIKLRTASEAVISAKTVTVVDLVIDIPEVHYFMPYGKSELEAQFKKVEDAIDKPTFIKTQTKHYMNDGKNFTDARQLASVAYQRELREQMDHAYAQLIKKDARFANGLGSYLNRGGNSVVFDNPLTSPSAIAFYKPYFFENGAFTVREPAQSALMIQMKEFRRNVLTAIIEKRTQQGKAPVWHLLERVEPKNSAQKSMEIYGAEIRRYDPEASLQSALLTLYQREYRTGARPPELDELEAIAKDYAEAVSSYDAEAVSSYDNEIAAIMGALTGKVMSSSIGDLPIVRTGIDKGFFRNITQKGGIFDY